MEVTILGKKFKLPEGVTADFIGMDSDQRIERTIDYLLLAYPKSFSRMPKVDYSETPGGMIDMQNPPPSYVAQQQWIKDNPFAHRIKDVGDRRSIPEGLTLGHGGEAEAAIRSILAGNFPFIGEGFKKDYAKVLRDIDMSYRIYERLYPIEALGGEMVGGVMLGSGYGAGKTATIKGFEKITGLAPQVKKAWGTLNQGDKWKRVLSTLGVNALTGYGIVGTYRHGKGEGGPIGWTDESGGERLQEAFVGRPDEPWWAKPYTLGPAIGVGTPFLTRLLGGAVKDITGTPSQQLSRETVEALGDVTGAGWSQSKALKKMGLLDEVDPSTGLPLPAMERGVTEDLLTIPEGRTAPAILRGQEPSIGPQEVPLTALEREARWAARADPIEGAGYVGVLTDRANQSTKRIIDELYDASLGAERDAGEFLAALRSNLETRYTAGYNKAYLIKDMPIAGANSFRDVLLRSMAAEDNSLLVQAYQHAQTEMGKRVQLRALGEDVSIFSIPSAEVGTMMDLDVFLSSSGSLPVYQAHAVARRAGELVRSLRKDPEGMQVTDLNLADKFIARWNKAIDMHTADYTAARHAYRTTEVYDEALVAGRNLKDMTPAEVKAAYNTLEAPEGLSTSEAASVKDNMQKLFVSGAVEQANLANLSNLSSVLKKGELDRLAIVLKKEGRMTEFSKDVAASQAGTTAEEVVRKGPGLGEKIIHGAPAAAFSLPFYLSREAGAIGRTTRLLNNQKIASEIQRLTLSTSPVTKREAIQQITDYARSAVNAKDRSILNMMVRMATSPEVENKFSVSGSGFGLIE